MTQRFVIEVQDKRGSGSSARGSSQSSTSNPAALLDAQAKAAEKAAKAATDAQIREGKRAQQAALAYSQIIERESNRIGAIQARAAKKAADDQAKEAKRASDAVIREADRTARGIERAAAAAAAANRRAQQQALQGTFRGTRAASTGIGGIGSGLGQAAGTLAGGASDAVSGILGGSILSGDPIRAIAGLATSGLKAGAQLAGAIGKGLGQALPGALSAVGGIIGSIFSGAGGLVGGLLGKIVGNLAGGLSKAIGAALSIAGELGGILTSAVGEIAGFIGDKLGLALKVAIGGAAGVAFLGLRDALKEDKINGFFERFAQKSGVTATQGVEKLTAATQGLINVLDLKAAAQLADQRQAVTSIDQLAELAQFANEFGDSLGKDAAEGLDILTESLGRLQSKGLKGALGESADFNKEIERVAESVGLTADQIGEADQHTIAFSVTMKALRANFQGLNKEANGPSESFERLHASIDNTLLKIGQSLLPALDRVLKAVEPIAKAVGKFFDNNNKQVADGIANAVGTLTDKLAKVPAIIANIKLDEVFGLIGESAVAVWDLFTKAAKASFVVISAEARNLFDTLAEEAKDLVPFSRVNGVGRSKSEQAEFDKARVSRNNSARERSATSQAGAALTAAGGDFNAALDKIADKLAAIAARAGTGALPTSPSVQPPSHPSASFGGGNPLFDGRGTATTGGSSSGASAIQGATAAVVTAANLTAGTLTGLSGVFAEAARQSGIKKRIEAEKAGAAASEEEFRQRERMSDLARKQADIDTESVTKHAAAEKKILEEEEKSVAAVRASRDQQLADIAKAKDAAIAANNKAATDSLIGEVGGLGADASGIPAKLQRAAKKVRRVANREKKDSLNSLSAGLSVDELAANGGAALKGVLAQQGAKDAAGANAAAKREAEIAANQAENNAAQEVARLQSESSAKLEELAKETDAALLETTAALNKSADLQEDMIRAQKDQAEAMKAFEKRIADLEKQLKSVPPVGGRG